MDCGIQCGEDVADLVLAYIFLSFHGETVGGVIQLPADVEACTIVGQHYLAVLHSSPPGLVVSVFDLRGVPSRVVRVLEAPLRGFLPHCLVNTRLAAVAEDTNMQLLLVATNGRVTTIQVWNVETGSCLLLLEMCQDVPSISAVAASPTGLVCFLTDPGTLFVHDLLRTPSSVLETWVRPGLRECTFMAGFTAAAPRLVLQGSDALVVYDMAPGEARMIASLELADSRLLTGPTMLSNSCFVLHTWDFMEHCIENLLVWDMELNQVVQRLPVDPNKLGPWGGRVPLLAAAGMHVVMVRKRGVVVWDLARGCVDHEIEGTALDVAVWRDFPTMALVLFAGGRVVLADLLDANAAVGVGGQLARTSPPAVEHMLVKGANRVVVQHRCPLRGNYITLHQ